MGQTLGRFWERMQGKPQLRKICDRNFHKLAEGDQNGLSLLKLTNLHHATLMVYNDINKHFTSPHKDPPTIIEVDEAAKALKTRRDGALDEDEFHGFILQRIQKDLRKYLVNKILISIIAAPAMALFAKNTADKVPLIERVVEKVPTQAFVPVCAVGIVLLQDVRVD